ncbi:hypothetical protein [Arthrobacter sp. 18067]|nr:hypothetical protein [Arthrobacter sp. 18067]
MGVPSSALGLEGGGLGQEPPLNGGTVQWRHQVTALKRDAFRRVLG